MPTAEGIKIFNKCSGGGENKKRNSEVKMKDSSRYFHGLIPIPRGLCSQEFSASPVHHPGKGQVSLRSKKRAPETFSAPGGWPDGLLGNGVDVSAPETTGQGRLEAHRPGRRLSTVVPRVLSPLFLQRNL